RDCCRQCAADRPRPRGVRRVPRPPRRPACRRGGAICPRPPPTGRGPPPRAGPPLAPRRALLRRTLPERGSGPRRGRHARSLVPPMTRDNLKAAHQELAAAEDRLSKVEAALAETYTGTDRAAQP